VVRLFAYAATPSGDTLGETALNSKEIYCPDEIKGQAISAFVSLEHGVEPTIALKEELKKWVAKEIGSLAKPDDIPVYRHASENAQREDHTPLAKRVGQQRVSERRYNDTGRFRGDRKAKRAGRSLTALLHVEIRIRVRFQPCRMRIRSTAFADC
jgi:hypothetical protein